MKYYVVADIHGFYSELITALKEKGYFEDKEPHELIICGDLLDRGQEAIELQSFILDLLSKNEVILIRGNHEDLLVELVENSQKWMNAAVFMTHHWSNGTVDSALQLTGLDLNTAIYGPDFFSAQVKNTPFFKTILPAMIDYFETENYIFVHGWIPCTIFGKGHRFSDTFIYENNWRTQNKEQWEKARWTNGMTAACKKVIEPNKTIVCGHWHSSYGHTILEGKGSEFGEDADFSPYYGKGIIAIDGCTAHSGIVNCIVIEDKNL